MTNEITSTSAIRCSLSRLSVWRKLAITSDVASKIISMEINPERLSGMSENLIPEMVPMGVDSEPSMNEMERETRIILEEALISALEKTTNLRSFTWRQEFSPLLADRLWRLLHKMGIQELYVIDNRNSEAFPPPKDQFDSVLDTPAV